MPQEDSERLLRYLRSSTRQFYTDSACSVCHWQVHECFSALRQSLRGDRIDVVAPARGDRSPYTAIASSPNQIATQHIAIVGRCNANATSSITIVDRCSANVTRCSAIAEEFL